MGLLRKLIVHVRKTDTLAVAAISRRVKIRITQENVLERSGMWVKTGGNASDWKSQVGRITSENSWGMFRATINEVLGS